MQELETPTKPPARPKATSESTVLKACIRVLKRRRDVVLYERRTVLAGHMNGRYIRTGVKGRADLWACLSGNDGGQMHVEIEVKRPGKGRSLSPAQRAFKAYCIKNGITYLVVTSAKNLDESLDKCTELW